MRILHILQYFYPAVRFGGPVTVVYGISKELARRGHEVIVYTSDVDNDYSRVSENIKEFDGIEVHYFRNLTTKTTPYKVFIVPSMVSTLKKNIKSFDVIHIHGYRSFQNPAICKLSKSEAIPYIIHAHGTLPRIMAKQRLKWMYDVLFGYRLLRDASKVIALSQMEAQQYREISVPEEKIEVIPNGIDLSEYANLPSKGAFKKKFSIDYDEKIMLYLGRIHESKGLDLLAHAFNFVSKDLSNVRLVVVGPDDGYAATFSRLISDLGIEEKVLLTGFVEKTDKLAALVDSELFVTPRFYGFPVTFLESCLAGCPIVTASNGLDWIHDNVGYVVENSPVALAKAISNILRDERVHKKLQNSCRHIIKNFDISMIASRLENTYKSVVK